MAIESKRSTKVNKLQNLNSLRFKIPQYLRLRKIIKFFSNNMDKSESVSIIDVGCANGALLDLLLKFQFDTQYVGIDIRQDEIEKLKAKYPNQEFYCQDVEKEFSINKKFDYIIMLAMIEHSDNPYQCLKYLNTFLKKNGRIFITTPIKMSPVIEKVWGGLSPGEHKFYFNYSKLQKIAESLKMQLSYEKFQWGLNQFIILSNTTQ